MAKCYAFWHFIRVWQYIKFLEEFLYLSSLILNNMEHALTMKFTQVQNTTEEQTSIATYHCFVVWPSTANANWILMIFQD